MGTTLTGTTPQDTYDSLIKVTDNGPLSGTLKTLTDGLGNDSALALSTSAIKVTGSISGTNGFNGFAGATHNLLVDWSASSQFTTLTATDIFFGTNANERMRITSAGNVGIGTSSPAAKLHTYGGDLFLGLDWASANYDSTPRQFKIASNGDSSGYITQGAYYSAGTAATTFFRNYVNAASSGALVFESGAGNFNTNGGVPTSFSERMRITSSGNVGIGTASPSHKLDTRLTTNTDASQDIARFAANNLSGQVKTLDIIYQGSDNKINLRTNAVGADPVIAVNVGASEVARFTSNGLTFNGDTAAANALDDYEEGTFTPTMLGATFTLNTALGYYTKIGRQVSIWIECQGTYSSPTGVFRVASLPFTQVGGRAEGTFSPIQGISYVDYCTSETLGTLMYLESHASGTGGNRTDMGSTFFNSAGFRFMISQTYFV